jgi:RimJ/RimL family protein N-acetyltransferase
MSDRRFVHLLTLRPATTADARLLHEWRNDPKSRQASRNTAFVPWPEHCEWLAAVLVSPHHIMRIAEEDGKPLGMVRADRRDQGWELSWTVAPQARKKGIGHAMLQQFVAVLDGRLTAVIRKDNVASARIAAAAGFEQCGEAPTPEFDLWVLPGHR